MLCPSNPNVSTKSGQLLWPRLERLRLHLAWQRGTADAMSDVASISKAP